VIFVLLFKFVLKGDAAADGEPHAVEFADTTAYMANVR